MEHCPICQSPLRGNRKCFNCYWIDKEAMLRRGPMPPPVRKKLVLESPPTCHKVGVHEARYLTHCANIARIIASCESLAAVKAKVGEYLRLTKDEEVV